MTPAVFIGGPIDGEVRELDERLTHVRTNHLTEDDVTPLGIYESSDERDAEGRVVMRWRPIGT